MKKWVCGIIVFVFLLTFSDITLLKPADAMSFSDVSSDYWAASEIADLAGKGVLSGYPDGTFKPDNNVTRAEFAKIIGLALGYSSNPSTSQQFPDVGADHWAFGYVASAADHGLVQGYPDGTFDPGRNVTKAEILTIIARAKNWSGGSGNHFNDVPSGYWAFAYIEACFTNGIVKNPDPNIVYSGNLGPDEPATRAQTCVFTDRMLNPETEGEAETITLGGGGCAIPCLAIDPSNPQTLYTGTSPRDPFSGGVCKSIDGGLSWSASWLPVIDVFCLAIDPVNPQTLYIGHGGGIFKSSNGGEGKEGWADFSSGLMTCLVQCLAIDPGNPQTLYAGTGEGIFKSSDGGASWTASSSGLTYPWIWCLAIDPSNPQTLYAGTWSESHIGGIYKSIDGGASWSPSSSGLTKFAVGSIVIDPSNPQTLYAGTYDGVYKSVDGGTNWTDSSSGLTDRDVYPEVFSLAIDPSHPQTLYAAISNQVHPSEYTFGGDTFGEVRKSSDGGASWAVSLPELTRNDVLCLAIDPLGTIYAGTDVGIEKSSDGGASWVHCSRGLPDSWYPY